MAGKRCLTVLICGVVLAKLGKISVSAFVSSRPCFVRLPLLGLFWSSQDNSIKIPNESLPFQFFLTTILLHSFSREPRHFRNHTRFGFFLSHPDSGTLS